MTTRDEFIGAIAKALGRAGTPSAPAPFTWRHSVHTDVMKDYSPDELSRAFIEYSEAIDVGVFQTIRDELNATLQKAVEECGPGPVIMANDALLNELDTATALKTDRTVQIWNADAPREDNIRFAEETAVGIAVAERALAESATVLLFSSNGLGRSVTLLPESVIYIIPRSRICPRLTQGMAHLRQNKENLPSSVNFVSGPSATSDIELVRVVGIHGPSHVVHIVVHDI